MLTGTTLGWPEKEKGGHQRGAGSVIEVGRRKKELGACVEVRRRKKEHENEIT